MITFIGLCYAALVIVLFKCGMLRPRPYPIAAVVVAGVLLLAGIVAAWELRAPMSSRLVVYRKVLQIVPYVKGQVKKVYAQPNQPIRKGDLLLEIDAAPYQYTLSQAQAQLQSAQDNVKLAGAALDVAKANVTKAEAGVVQAQAAIAKADATVNDASAGVEKAKSAQTLAKTKLQIDVATAKQDAGAISKLDMARAEQNFQAAVATVTQAITTVAQAKAAKGEADANLTSTQAAVVQAQASVRQAEFSALVAKSSVSAFAAEVDTAKFNLDQCKVTAPADGYVVNWGVTEGTMVASLPMAPVGTFIDTTETIIAAAFPQNYLVNVRPGNKVELALDPHPGVMVEGEVDAVIEASGEGQITVTGNIPTAAKVGSQGMLVVRIKLTGASASLKLPMGAGGTAAIYTDVGKPVHVISKVTIRMKKWLLYVLPA